jgi:ATP-dependent DNA ligase
MPPSAPSPLGFIKPEIPTLVLEPPSGDGWIHEIKHDGYRTLIIIDGGKVRAFSRHGRDCHRIVFFAFDLLHLEGQDLRRTPLIERRATLRKLIESDPRLPGSFLVAN